MAKMYTLDDKLLVGTPEIRIGDSVYPIDDREKTVKKIMKLFDEEDVKDSIDNIDKVLALVFAPKDYKKIDAMNMRYEAYQELLSIVMAAIMGADYNPDKKKDDTFHE